ncbi:hypothetical protein VCRA2110O135_170034 [Vibrio crassostreae]|nr:hypothetical protein VCRA2110O135_170034 [Vibrio crassostreae]
MNLLYESQNSGHKITIANLVYKPDTSSLFAGGERINLDPRLKDVLELLLQNVNIPISTNYILEEVWGNNHISPNVVVNRISALRSILSKYNKEHKPTDILSTYPRKGYFLSSEFVFISQDHDTTDIVYPSTIPDNIGEEHDDVIKPFLKSKLLPFLSVLSVLVLFAFVYFLHKDNSSDENYNSSDENYNSQYTILLDRIYSDGNVTNKEKKVINESLFATIDNDSRIDLVNTKSPLYYLSESNSVSKWLGSENNNLGQSIIRLKITKPRDKYIVKTIISTRSTGFNKSILMSLDDISNLSSLIYLDIAKHFNLDVDNTEIEKDYGLLEIKELDLEYVLSTTLTNLNYTHIINISRLLLNEKVKDKYLVEKWVKEVNSSSYGLDPQIVTWIGLVSFKYKFNELSLKYLSSIPYDYRKENPLVEVVLSYLYFQNGNFKESRDFYYNSIFSLSNFIEIELIYKLIQRKDSDCLDIWRVVQRDVLMVKNNKDFMNLKSEYCSMIQNINQENEN